MDTCDSWTSDYRAVTSKRPCIRCQAPRATFQRGVMPLCEPCATAGRRVEVNRWLDEIGAVLIPVRDLGAALEARTELQEAICGSTFRPPIRHEMYSPEILAAHLARLALWEP